LLAAQTSSAREIVISLIGTGAEERGVFASSGYLRLPIELAAFRADGLPRGCRPFTPVRNGGEGATLRSLGINREDGAVEGLLALGGALTRGYRWEFVSFPFAWVVGIRRIGMRRRTRLAASCGPQGTCTHVSLSVAEGVAQFQEQFLGHEEKKRGDRPRRRGEHGGRRELGKRSRPIGCVIG
jgi:hypothetical protein